jgi:hypothetical protein
MTELAFANGFRLPEESGNRGGRHKVLGEVQELRERSWIPLSCFSMPQQEEDL